MEHDIVDELIKDWTRERPDLDPRGLGIATRISLLAKTLGREAKLALRPTGLAPWACDVLLGLRRQGPPYQMTPSDLSKLSMLSSGAMTTRLDRLEKAGLVTRRLDSADRRSFKVSLTERGVRVADRALEARLEMVNRLLTTFTAKERQATTDLLRKLLAASRSS